MKLFRRLKISDAKKAEMFQKAKDMGWIPDADYTKFNERMSKPLSLDKTKRIVAIIMEEDK